MWDGGEHSVGSERSGWAEGSPLLVLSMGGRARLGVHTHRRPRRALLWAPVLQPTQTLEGGGVQQKLENRAETEGPLWGSPGLGWGERHCQLQMSSLAGRGLSLNSLLAPPGRRYGSYRGAGRREEG